jgi:hypothetical protein
VSSEEDPHPEARDARGAEQGGLVAGRWYERRLLLFSALMVSANDSATALAHAAGEGSLARFYRRMNRRARGLGMTQTTQASASGLEDGAKPLDRARPAILACRAREPGARKDRPDAPQAREMATAHAREGVAEPQPHDSLRGNVRREDRLHDLAAGGCLVVAVERDGHHLIGVVLKSENIWRDMPRLMDAAFRRLG